MGLRDYGFIVLRGYGFKALHVLGLFDYGVIGILNLAIFKVFLRLGQNPDVQESNRLWIRFQREKIHRNVIVGFFAQNFFLWSCILILCNTEIYYSIHTHTQLFYDDFFFNFGNSVIQ